MHRREDRPLHRDVRRLASCLGQVVRRVEGEDAYEAVEALRQACQTRRADGGGWASILRALEAHDTQTLAHVARAFTLFFLLINTAEQVHRVRRNQARTREGRQDTDSLEAFFRRAKEASVAPAALAAQVEGLVVHPVLTAHPTESTRRTILDLLSRVAKLLMADRFDAPALRAEVELLWLTSEVRQDRPSVMDEVATAVWYLRERLFDAHDRLQTLAGEAHRNAFPDAPPIRVPLRIGSWVGGDRDGNPFVTPDTTEAAVHAAAEATLTRYIDDLDALTQKLSIARSVASALPADVVTEADRARFPAVWERHRKRDADEPVRMKLSLMRARITATRAALRKGANADAEEGYETPGALADDLDRLAALLTGAGASSAAQQWLHPLQCRVRAFGFHGFALDVREDATAHQEALSALAHAVATPLDSMAALTEALDSPRPLYSPRMQLDDAFQRRFAVFEAMRRMQKQYGRAACETYIISMCKRAEDVLSVLLLAKEAGLTALDGDPARAAIDIAPLFETEADLAGAPQVLRTLFAHPVYRKQLAARGHVQEVMIGYSDSAKDAGHMGAAWGLYRAQVEMSEVATAAGITLRFFHGRGGTVGRGGGSPVYRALLALPTESARGGVKTTEQGEVISQKFGLLPIAERSLEVLTVGTWDAAAGRGVISEGDRGPFFETMTRMAERATEHYRAVVHNDPTLFETFRTITPVEALAEVHFGSRPTYRRSGMVTAKNLRAIPWVFGWTQIRLMLPAWLGVGTALAQQLDTEEGDRRLRRMYAHWPFFRDFIDKVEMVLAKSDLDVARLYWQQQDVATPDDATEATPNPDATRAGFERLAQEHARTVQAVKAIKGIDALLDEQPVLQTSIGLRNPYVDALSAIQLLQMKRARKAPLSAEHRRILGTTLNGIAQGLRNTG